MEEDEFEKILMTVKQLDSKQLKKLGNACFGQRLKLSLKH
jgi:hypothetical protein